MTKKSTGGDGRDLSKTDNQTAEQIAASKHAAEQAKREEARLTRISVRHRLRLAKAKVEEVRGPFDAAKADVTEIYRLGKLAGFSRADLDEDLVDMNMDPRKFREKEAARAERKSDFADPGEQADFMDGAAPQEKRDDAYWQAQGYIIAMRYEPCVVPEGCHGSSIQAFNKGWHDGNVLLAAAMTRAEAEIAEDSAKGDDTDAPAKDENEPKPDEFEASPEELAAQRARQAIAESRAGEAEAV